MDSMKREHKLHATQKSCITETIALKNKNLHNDQLREKK